MLRFWRYLFGYVTICLTGENAEQLLNNAAKNGINIWGLRCKKGNITGNISVKHFFMLRFIKRGIKCKVKIINKKGLVFFTNKYKKRFGFIIGFTLFLLILNILSEFIWIINVNGNITVSTIDILNSCKNIGITQGVFSKKINPQNDAQRLLLLQDGLAWASLNIEGSVLTVNLSEIKASDKEERKLPSNIKADFDGKIRKIDVVSGNVAVKVGDYVKKGDLLVSGIVEQMGSTLFIHSQGQIIAQTQRSFIERGDFVQQIKTKNNNTISRNVVEIFGIRIPLYLGSVKGEYDFIKKSKDIEILGKRVPIKFVSKKCTIIEEKTVTYTADELEKILYEKIADIAANSDFIEYSEIDKNIRNTEKGIEVEVLFSCVEDIAIEDLILLDR